MSGKTEKDKQKVLQEKHQAILFELLKSEDNKYCVDCDAKGPRWASWNLGVFLCIRCAGIHRNLGVHVSKVKSVNLDSWTPEQLQMVQQMGNRRARSVYEAELPANFRRPQTDSGMEALIRAKYELKKYIDKDWQPPQLSSVVQSCDGSRKEKKNTRLSLGEHLTAQSRSLSHIKNASDSRLSSSVKHTAHRDSSEPRTSSAASASRRHRDASPTSSTNDTLPPVELISLASPEPETKSSLTDFGNFVGVDLATVSSTPATASTTSVTDVANIATTSANKQATKDDIMALYTPTNNSALYNMPHGGVYMSSPAMNAVQSTMPVMHNAAPMMMMPAANGSVCPMQPMSYGVYPPQMMVGYPPMPPADMWSSQQPARQPHPQHHPPPPQPSSGYTLSNQLWQ